MMGALHLVEGSLLYRQLSPAAQIARGKSGPAFATPHVTFLSVQHASPSAQASVKGTTREESVAPNVTSESVHHALLLLLQSAQDSVKGTTWPENVAPDVTSQSALHVKLLLPSAHDDAKIPSEMVTAAPNATSQSAHPADPNHQHAPANANVQSEMGNVALSAKAIRSALHASRPRQPVPDDVNNPSDGATASLNAPAIHCVRPATLASAIGAQTKPTTEFATSSAPGAHAETRRRIATSHRKSPTRATFHPIQSTRGTTSQTSQIVQWDKLVDTSHTNHIVALWGIMSTRLPSQFSYSYQFMIVHYLNLVVFLNFLSLTHEKQIR